MAGENRQKYSNTNVGVSEVEFAIEGTSFVVNALIHEYISDYFLVTPRKIFSLEKNIDLLAGRTERDHPFNVAFPTWSAAFEAVRIWSQIFLKESQYKKENRSTATRTGKHKLPDRSLVERHAKAIKY